MRPDREKTASGGALGAPSWAGLIAIADSGLALARKGSLANAQDDLYQLPSSDFNDITSGSTPFHGAGPGFDLVTGPSSPKANLLIPALVKANGGSSVVTPATTAHRAISIAASPHDGVFETSGFRRPSREGPKPGDDVAAIGRGGYRAAWEARSIPSFFKRCRRVLGWSPRILAAPRGPSITQLVWSRTLEM
jgi:hypothetical protein